MIAMNNCDSNSWKLEARYVILLYVYACICMYLDHGRKGRRVCVDYDVSSFCVAFVCLLTLGCFRLTMISVSFPIYCLATVVSQRGFLAQFDGTTAALPTSTGGGRSCGGSRSSSTTTNGCNGLLSATSAATTTAASGRRRGAPSSPTTAANGSAGSGGWIDDASVVRPTNERTKAHHDD